MLQHDSATHEECADIIADIQFVKCVKI